MSNSEIVEFHTICSISHFVIDIRDLFLSNLLIFHEYGIPLVMVTYFQCLVLEGGTQRRVLQSHAYAPAPRFVSVPHH